MERQGGPHPAWADTGPALFPKLHRSSISKPCRLRCDDVYKSSPCLAKRYGSLVSQTRMAAVVAGLDSQPRLDAQDCTSHIAARLIPQGAGSSREVSCTSFKPSCSHHYRITGSVTSRCALGHASDQREAPSLLNRRQRRRSVNTYRLRGACCRIMRRTAQRGLDLVSSLAGAIHCLFFHHDLRHDLLLGDALFTSA